ncbi:hypothetical protein [uncultured Granulicatella sp.]|uniref:hypothetical protein n=1 Tax=uncultured Granulicatella sp. TaxID=316089 RepID=UPI00262DF1DC|nr:hypothetical protein [uncultured Granulicatella sp.]
MKKIFIFIAIVIGIFAVVQCSRPTITKEQQNNVVTRIARRYDISEVEFLRFTKNWSTGSYILQLKLDDDDSKEVTMIIEDKKELDSVDLELVLNPIGEYDDIERAEKITGDISISNIKIKYLGE